MTNPTGNLSERFEFDIERAGATILNELCGGDPEAAIELIRQTENEVAAKGRMTDRGASQLRALRDWVRAQAA
jgi:hypothetical protein